MQSSNKAMPSTATDVVVAIFCALALALILQGLQGLLGCSAKADEEITAAAERAAHDKKITFTLPVEYTATVTQCNTKDGCRTRLYFPSSKREAQR
jgi:hypothetical protein